MDCGGCQCSSFLGRKLRVPLAHATHCPDCPGFLRSHRPPLHGGCSSDTRCSGPPGPAPRPGAAPPLSRRLRRSCCRCWSSCVHVQQSQRSAARGGAPGSHPLLSLPPLLTLRSAPAAASAAQERRAAPPGCGSALAAATAAASAAAAAACRPAGGLDRLEDEALLDGHASALRCRPLLDWRLDQCHPGSVLCHSHRVLPHVGHSLPPPLTCASCRGGYSRRPCNCPRAWVLFVPLLTAFLGTPFLPLQRLSRALGAVSA